MNIAVVIPSYNGFNDLDRLLKALSDQEGSFDVLVVDSGSTDGTNSLLKTHPVIKDFFTIPSAQFNHGGTRQLVVDKYPHYDIYVYLTQDAYPADRRAIVNLTRSFQDPAVGAACGRQLPHLDADVFGAHARLFNYPDMDTVRSKKDIPAFGIKVPFISNSFSAYRREALMQVGGFPDDVILGEDMFVAAKMVLNDWKIAYVGSARVHHSHNYTMLQEWRRYFDIGVFHAREPWIRKQFGGAGGEGLRFVRSELSYCGRRVHLWLLSLLRNGGKLIAYKLGQLESRLPKSVKRMLSMHRKYWD